MELVEAAQQNHSSIAIVVAEIHLDYLEGLAAVGLLTLLQNCMEIRSCVEGHGKCSRKGIRGSVETR